MVVDRRGGLRSPLPPNEKGKLPDCEAQVLVEVCLLANILVGSGFAALGANAMLRHQAQVSLMGPYDLLLSPHRLFLPPGLRKRSIKLTIFGAWWPRTRELRSRRVQQSRATWRQLSSQSRRLIQALLGGIGVWNGQIGSRALELT